MQWKVLTICPDRKLSLELNPLLAEHLPFAPTMEVKEYPSRSDIGEALQAQMPNLAFVDVATNREWALSIVSDLSALDSKLPIVALHAGNDPDYILRCLRMGASEFLISPINAEQMETVLDRIASLHRNGRGNGSGSKVICVMPAKGACGASTLACSLAFQYKKYGAARILLADLDPLTGTLSFQLKLKQTYSFMDAMSRAGGLDLDIWKGLVYTTQGVDVLLAPDQPVHGIDEAHDPVSLVEFARMHYDVVVADTGGAYGAWPLAVARCCDELLLVTTNELPALQATQRSLAYLERSRVDRGKIKIVVNRYHKDIGLNQDVIEAALHSDVYHLIPSDYESLQRALVEGKPVAVGSSVAKSISALAEKLSGRKKEAPPVKTSGLASLFSSLLRR